jgi:hypothetical protein
MNLTHGNHWAESLMERFDAMQSPDWEPERKATCAAILLWNFFSYSYFVTFLRTDAFVNEQYAESKRPALRCRKFFTSSETFVEFFLSFEHVDIIESA